MKTLSYICDWMGIIMSLLGGIAEIYCHNIEASLWAFAAMIWSIGAFVRDLELFKRKL